MKCRRCPLGCGLHHCGTFTGGKKKGDAIRSSEWSQWSKKSSFCHVNCGGAGGGGGGHRLDSFRGAERRRSCRDFPPSIQTLLHFFFFVCVLDCFGSPAACRESSLSVCMSPGHLDCISSTVSNTWTHHAHAYKGQTAHEIHATYTAAAHPVVLSVLCVCVLVLSVDNNSFVV